MELKEYIQIIKKYKFLYLAFIVVVMLGSFAFFYLRPVRFDTSLLINITRSGSQNTADYKYDDFYRLQADEKFAETVVEWLKSAKVRQDILGEHNSRVSIAAEKRSSQIVAISFSTPDIASANIISMNTVKVLENLTENLNKGQNEDTWFKIAPEEPVVQRYQPNFNLIFLGSLIGGIFLGFWIILIKNYLE